MDPRRYVRELSRNDKIIFIIWLFVLGVSSPVTSLPDGVEELCQYRDSLVPKKLYDHLIGWSCFEESQHQQDQINIYVCATQEGYRVPCIKNGSVFMDFGSQESRYLIFSRIAATAQHETLQACFFDNPACDNSGLHGIARVWMPGTNTTVCSTEARNKFHIAMLSISFFIGVPATIVLWYFAWSEESEFFRITRNMISAITFRSLLTLLIQTEIILPMSQGSMDVNDYGIPALMTFETLTINLVLGYWMLFNVFIWKTVQKHYSEKLLLTTYSYAVLGLCTMFTIIWIIVMACTQTLQDWLGVRYWSQWINEPLRILFLAYQMFALWQALRLLLKEKHSHWSEKGRRIRLALVYVVLLAPLFVLQFALNAGTPTGDACEEAFYYTFYFFDGIQGAVICLFFFYIDFEVVGLFKEFFGLKKQPTPLQPPRVITTLDSLKEKRQSTANSDVMLSSIVTPDKYEKVIDLYKKHNLAPKTSVVVVDGDVFQTCSNEAVRKMSVVSQYYDAVSENDVNFEDLEDYEPQALQNSEEDGNDLKKTNNVVALGKAVEVVQVDVTTTAEKNSLTCITPIHHSKYSSINRSSGSSISTQSSSVNDKDVVVLSGFDGTESRDDFGSLKRSKPVSDVRNLNYSESSSSESSSDSESTSDESRKSYPMAEPVEGVEELQETKNFLRVKAPLNRQSTEAVKGSSSEESINTGHIPSNPLFFDLEYNRMSAPELQHKIPEVVITVETPQELKSNQKFPLFSNSEPLKGSFRSESSTDESDDAETHTKEASLTGFGVNPSLSDTKGHRYDSSSEPENEENYNTVLINTRNDSPKLNADIFCPPKKENNQDLINNSSPKNDYSRDEDPNLVSLGDYSSMAESIMHPFPDKCNAILPATDIDGGNSSTMAPSVNLELKPPPSKENQSSNSIEDVNKSSVFILKNNDFKNETISFDSSGESDDDIERNKNYSRQGFPKCTPAPEHADNSESSSDSDDSSSSSSSSSSEDESDIEQEKEPSDLRNEPKKTQLNEYTSNINSQLKEETLNLKENALQQNYQIFKSPPELTKKIDTISSPESDSSSSDSSDSDSNSGSNKNQQRTSPRAPITQVNQKENFPEVENLNSPCKSETDSEEPTMRKPKTFPKPFVLSKLNATDRNTLPEIYKDLDEPVSRPKSLGSKRDDISKMFAHRSKFLSSKSLNDHNKQSNEGKVSLVVKSLIIPTGTAATQPANHASDLSYSSSEDETKSSDSCASMVKGPVPTPRMILQQKSHSWDPQEVSFTDS